MKKWHWLIIGITGIGLLVSPIFLHGQAEKKKAYYQYKAISTGAEIETLEKNLNELALQGWIMVNGTDNIVYLRRKVRAQ